MACSPCLLTSGLWPANIPGRFLIPFSGAPPLRSWRWLNPGWVSGLGLTLLLHTWTRELLEHPHAHVLVTAGGLTPDGTFKRIRKKVLLHVKPLAKLFKGKMMDALRVLRKTGVIVMSDGAFGTLMASLKAQNWVVYLKRTFQRPEDTLKYLGRYTHRVGIYNSRLEESTSEKVTFRTKTGRTVTVHPVEFLRRFVQHILPDGFKKIRHAGLYAAPKALAKARADLGPLPVAQKSITHLGRGPAPVHRAGCGPLLPVRSGPVYDDDSPRSPFPPENPRSHRPEPAVKAQTTPVPCSAFPGTGGQGELCSDHPKGKIRCHNMRRRRHAMASLGTSILFKTIYLALSKPRETSPFASDHNPGQTENP